MGGTFDRDLKEILDRAGWTFVRPGKGSHQIWHSPITIAVPTGIVSRHTANGVLKDAGLPKAF